MKFTHLHTHSHYSLLDGLPKIGELLDYTKELGMDSLALTDHGNMYGAVEFFVEAKKRGIKPIIGVEAYVASGKYDDFTNITNNNNNNKRDYRHLVILVKNKQGYQNLVKLVTEAHLRGFYYRPRIDEELLERYSEGLIITSACLAGKIPQLILSKEIKEVEKTILKYQSIFKDDFYLELQYHSLPEQKIVNEKLIEYSKKFGIKLIASNDIHYLKKEDNEVQDILLAINTGHQVDDANRLTMKDFDLSMLSPEEMIENFKNLPEAISNTQEIVEKCNFEFELGKFKIPSFIIPDNKSADEYLKELAYRNIERKYPDASNQKTKEIKERLDYELSVVKESNFSSYFLIVQDFVDWSKKNKIVVGPGRGSAAGCIISYLIGITNVDPLRYSLIFERFLTPGRRGSPPDIDLDFADHRRDEVFNYISKKYGQEKVAQIITFGTIAARAGIRDVGRVLNYPYSYCDRLAKMIPIGFSLDKTLKEVREFREVYENDLEATKLIDLAKKLEGVVRHASTHACGLVISDQLLEEIVPMQKSSVDENVIISQYDMYSVEKIGLLKMDILGLKNLTIIEKTLEAIKKRYNFDLDIENIKLDDKKTFKLLQEGKTVSVFQLECLSGDTQISTTTIKKLYERKNKSILESVYLDEGKVHKNKILNVVQCGEKELYLLITENDLYIKATKDHYFLTENGWMKLEDIKIGEKVLVKTRFKYLIYNTCKNCGIQINGQKGGKSNFCYRCSASFFKNPSKKESREKIRAARIRFYQRGGKPWNYGLNIENSDKVAEIGKQISKALAGKSLEDRCGKEKADRLKKLMSKKFSGKGNPMFGKPSPHRKGGFREDLGHYVRSNWEADFARILRYYNLEYEYEPKIFQLIRPNGEILHYTPDFYVKSDNTFYEIKGWLHDVDKEKIELFQKQYPQYNLVLVSATKFAEFALQYKNLINWECPRMPARNRFRFIKVKQIKYCGKEMTYDIQMASPGNNFVAQGFVVHNSGGMRRFLKEMKPDRFEDIIAQVALYRPGPIKFFPTYIARKQKKEEITYLDPRLKPILKETYGLAIYQEQILKIAQVLAGFTLTEADVLRKAVGKKIKELLNSQKEKFIKGMITNGASKQVSNEVWKWILPFASYGFNRAHSAGYALIAYQTAYLKAHYSTEFMASVLNSEKDAEKFSLLINECKGLGIEVLAPEINESKSFFTVIDNGKIRFGMSAIKNVGQGIVDAIINERKRGGDFKSFFDFLIRVKDKDLNKRSLESLIKTGVFDKLEKREKLLYNMEYILDFIKELKQHNNNGKQVSLFGSSVNSIELKLKESEKISETEKLGYEKELLGIYVSGHPLDSCKKILTAKAFPISKISKNDINKRIQVGGIVNAVKKILTKTGQQMFFIKIEDLTGSIEVIAFPKVAIDHLGLFEQGKILFIYGTVNNKDGEIKILVERVEEIKTNN